MKKAPLFALAILVVCSAAPVHAYVQPSNVIGVPTQRTTSGSRNPRIDAPSDPTNWDQPDQSPAGGDNPTRPVPEPGTMAMASMGLLALGAAIRRKRGR